MFCDDLEGWDREGGREAQEGGDMGIYVCIWLAEMNSEQRCGQEIYSRGMIVEIEGIKYHRLSRISSKIAPVTIHS